MPMTKENFEKHQAKFKQALATVAGVKDTDVTIDKVTETMSRRVASIRVDSSVSVTGAKSADSVQRLLTADAINTELSKVGFPFGPFAKMLDSNSQAGSNDGGVPSFSQSKSASGESGAVIGGVAGTAVVCCMFALFFYLWRRRNLKNVRVNVEEPIPSRVDVEEPMPSRGSGTTGAVQDRRDEKCRWDRYCKSLSLSDLWESRGRSDQKLYNVDRNCPEFSFVEKLFMETMRNYRNSTITRVERVENEMQHATYTLQKKNIAMDITKARDTVSCGMEDRFVKWLFHGTKQQTINNIVNAQMAGYLPMLAGTAVGAIWGDGTYFARDAKYSHDYTEPKNDAITKQSQRKMLLNRVIVGEWVKGAEGLKLYPLAKGQEWRRCNSLVNDEKDPSIFVIQHSYQAYPAYVITYTSA
jgi:hypothetical protein